MPTQITPALIALFGAFCGMLISIFIARYTLTTAARYRFAASFTDELAILKLGEPFGEGNPTQRLLEEAFPKHNRAYVELCSVLDRFSRWRVEKRWQKYQYGDRPPDPDDRFTYLACSENEKEQKDVMRLAVRHIVSLIS
jgi:hypothetical protein